MPLRKMTIAGNRLKEQQGVKFLQYKSKSKTWEPFPTYDAGAIAHWYWEIKKVDGGSYWVPSSTTHPWSTKGLLCDEDGKAFSDNGHDLYYPQDIVVWIPDAVVKKESNVEDNAAGIADGIPHKAPNTPPGS